MPVREISLESLGLISVEDAAALKGVTPRSVQRWIADGLLPAIQAGSGNKLVYLLRRRDVERFTVPARGRPAKESG